MTVFVDASALVAIIAGEADADFFADRLAADPIRLCSALSLWETVSALRRSYALTISTARAQLDEYVIAGQFRLVPIGEREYALALEAYDRYGKGRHPAALNMGDCFAYACARSNGATLLYKGQDFARTDLA